MSEEIVTTSSEEPEEVAVQPAPINKKREFKTVVLDRRLYPGEVSLAVSADKQGMLRIPLTRETKMEHPFYGSFDFSRKWMNTVIRNFNNDVVGNELPVDAGHKPDNGALGWIKELKIEKTKNGVGLFAYAEPTQAATDLVASRSFQYSSMSFHPNFVEYEDVGQKNPIEYGPTLFGVALTNIPFVRRQEKVVMLSAVNQDGDDDELVIFEDQEEIMEDKTEPKVELSDPKPAPVEPPPPVAPVPAAPDNPNEIKLSRAEYESLQRSIQELTASARQGKIDTARSKAEARGVNGVTIDFVTSLMKSLDDTDKLVVFSKEERGYNAFAACEVFLSTFAPADVPVGPAQTVASQRPSDNDIDREAPEYKDMVANFARMATPIGAPPSISA